MENFKLRLVPYFIMTEGLFLVGLDPVLRSRLMRGKEKNLIIARKFGTKTILYESNTQLKGDSERFGVIYDTD